jgi:outer membrane lipoprotein-sorting protein
MTNPLYRMSALTFGLLSSAAAPAAAATTPAITAFDQAFTKVEDYTVTVTAHEVQGDRTQNRVYHYAFKRPDMAKTDIVSGDGTGSGGVWKGGTTVKGHIKFAFVTIPKVVDLHDSKAISLRGYTIPDGLIQNQVDRYRDTKGELTQHDGPQFNGAPTDEVDLKVADPSSDAGVTRAVLYFSKMTHFPVRQLRYEGDKVVTDETFSDLKTNVGLKDSDFPF